MPVVPDDLDQVAAAAAEDVEIAGMRDRARAPAAPAAPGRSCRAACRCGPPPARPGHRTGPGSSAQRRQHATQRRGADRLGNPHRRAVRQHDLDPVVRVRQSDRRRATMRPVRWRRRRRQLRHDAQRHEGRLLRHQRRRAAARPATATAGRGSPRAGAPRRRTSPQARPARPGSAASPRPANDDAARPR